MIRITTRFASLRTFITSLVIVLSLITSAATSNAAILPIGGIHFPVIAEPDPVGATLIASTGAVPFATSLYTGNLTSNVYTNDPTNPFGPTALTFTYLLHNDLGSIDALERLTVVNFDTFATDTSYQSPVLGGAIAPSYVNRSTTGGTVGFSFASFGLGTLSPGADSALLVVQTDAVNYFPSLANVINGAVAQVTSFSPATPIVPEPATFGAGVLGLVGLGMFARRRKTS
jgi:hypothetical protein